MTTRSDDLLSRLVGDTSADRLFYAEGVFLEAADLLDEQAYHRARLARSLDYLHGPGTAAGLEVTWHPATTFDGTAWNDELHVSPGLAVDRTGRLLELPQLYCTRLDRWFRQNRTGARIVTPAAALEVVDPADPGAAPAGAIPGVLAEAGDAEVTVIATHLVADLYLSFAVCERGLTPAFASGPFDATDAVQPSRLRDQAVLSLHLREESALDADPRANLPVSPWDALPDPAGSAEARRRWSRALQRAWHHGSADVTESGTLARPSWMPVDAPSDAVFLARIRIPVDAAGRRATPEDGTPPATTYVDGHTGRLHLFPTSALGALSRF